MCVKTYNEQKENLHGVAGFCCISNGPAGTGVTAHVMVSDSGSVTATVWRQVAAVAVSDTVTVVGRPVMTGAEFGVTLTVSALDVDPQESAHVTVNVKAEVPPNVGLLATSILYTENREQHQIKGLLKTSKIRTVLS